MKNTKILSLLLISLLSFGFTAAKGIDENANAARTKTVEHITNHLKKADKATQPFKNGVAVVTVKVDGNGQLHIIETNTPNLKIQRYIESQLDSMSLPKQSYRAGEEHTLRITFKTL
jgi:hypothetical protein